LGKPSCACRPLDVDEFATIIKLIREEVDPVKKYGFAALICTQFHFAGRVDDTCQILLNKIRVHATFSSALGLRLCWCKNVMEERAAPQQIMLGANNPHFCPILNLALYLEVLFPTDVNDVRKLHLVRSINKSANGIKKKLQTSSMSKYLNRKLF
jgi:hypothetical protein